MLAPIAPPVNTQPPFTGAGQFGWQILNRNAVSGFGLQAEGMAFAASSPTAMLLPGPGNLIFGSTGVSGIVTPAGLLIAVAALSYLLGAIPFGLVIATIIFFAAFKVIATLIMIATGSGVRHSG